ncbi:MAG TPA: ABC transporter substrate-binding protein [Alphaproteobacteria bacterium]
MTKSKAIGLAIAATMAWSAAALAADPVTIKLGRQTAAEEPLWVMMAKPELTPNQGKIYKLDITPFRASDATFKAYEGGQIDAGTASANAAIVAASKGLDFKIVASLSRESQDGSFTPYAVKADSPIKTIADLKGKTVGINGYRTSIELWARAALVKGGLDPDKDVNWAVVPFPAMAEAVKTGKVDVAGMPELFSKGPLDRGEIRPLFDSKTGVPEDEELILMLMRPSLMKEHPEAVRAFLADLATATQWYIAHPKEGRQAFLDAKLVRMPPELLFSLTDYKRDPNALPSVEALERQQELMIKLGFQEKRADIKKLVDLSLSPTK